MKEEQLNIRNFDEKKEKLLFHLFFLKNDEGQSVEVKDVEEVDFAEVEKRLEEGESVFITRKRQQHLDLRQVAREDAHGTRYFPHV